MSLGFSVSDFVTVGGLCWKLYKKCKDSPGNFKNLTGEVGALHNVIKETEELLSQQSLTVQQKEKLRVATVGCGEVLQDLDDLLARYRSMGTKAQKALDRWGFGTEDIDGIRTRLISNVTLLDAFNNASSNARLEEKLNILITEIRSGRREGSVISIETVDSIARNDQIAWEMFREELEDVGVSPSVIAEKRQFLIVWFQEAVAAGKLEEDIPEHEGNEDNDDLLEQNCQMEPLPLQLQSSTEDINYRPKRDGMTPSGGSQQVTSGKVSDPYVHSNTTDSQPDKNSRQQKNKNSRLRVSYVLSRLRSSKEDLFEAVRSGDLTRVKRALKQGNEVHVIKGDFNESPLHVATVEGMTEVVSLLLQHGHVVNCPDLYGLTPLHQAALNGRVQIAKLLLQHEAEIDCVDHLSKRDPLHLASLCNADGVARLLLEHGANVQAKDYAGNFPLHLASADRSDTLHSYKRARFATARVLLEKGADIDAVNMHGHTALHEAVCEGPQDTVEFLLERVNIQKKLYNKDQTPLHCAARSGRQDVVSLILAKGFDVNAKENVDYLTPLHYAAREGHEEITKTLLNQEAQVNVKDRYEQTPLFMAAENGHEQTINTLLHKGAEVNVKDRYKYTPLHVAALKGHEKMVEILLAKGAEVNAKNNEGQTSLHKAAEFAREESIKTLLAKGAEVNAKTRSGGTSLHKAAEYGHEGTVLILLGKGAEVNAKDENGQTSLHFAAERDHQKTVEILLDKGAEVNAKNNIEQTSLHNAVKEDHEEIVIILLAKGADPDAKDLGGNTASDLARSKGRHSIAMILDAAPRST
ncbi:hypothetical protein G7Y79_00052g087800 [Physcia stellaris]|nr:hypothetical protein G7Y79_00052g087800 [Physcia stellaris]